MKGRHLILLSVSAIICLYLLIFFPQYEIFVSLSGPLHYGPLVLLSWQVIKLYESEQYIYLIFCWLLHNLMLIIEFTTSVSFIVIEGLTWRYILENVLFINQEFMKNIYTVSEPYTVSFLFSFLSSLILFSEFIHLFVLSFISFLVSMSFSLLQEFNEFRSKCGLLWSFDWVSLPLVYTQVLYDSSHICRKYCSIKLEILCKTVLQ